MAIEPRVTLITLAVTDIARATAFYRGLGWALSSASTPEVSFFDLNGVVLALWTRAELAHDAGVAAGAPDHSGFALAQNQPDRATVDAVIAQAVAAGAIVTKPAAPTDWGGYSGYFADPDGNLWEIAHNPFWPLDPNGRLNCLRRGGGNRNTGRT